MHYTRLSLFLMWALTFIVVKVHGFLIECASFVNWLAWNSVSEVLLNCTWILLRKWENVICPHVQNRKKTAKLKKKQRKGIALIGPVVKEETHLEGGIAGGLGLEQGYWQEFKC